MRPFLSISPRPPASHRIVFDRPATHGLAGNANVRRCRDSIQFRAFGAGSTRTGGTGRNRVRGQTAHPPIECGCWRDFSLLPPGLSDQKSKITQQNHKQKVWVLRLKSEISILPTRAAKTGTGVAVHENLLDSVMTAPLKRESLLEQPNPIHDLNVDQSWQSENLDA